MILPSFIALVTIVTRENLFDSLYESDPAAAMQLCLFRRATDQHSHYGWQYQRIGHSQDKRIRVDGSDDGVRELMPGPTAFATGQTPLLASGLYIPSLSYCIDRHSYIAIYTILSIRTFSQKSHSFTSPHRRRLFCSLSKASHHPSSCNLRGDRPWISPQLLLVFHEYGERYLKENHGVVAASRSSFSSRSSVGYAGE